MSAASTTTHQMGLVQRLLSISKCAIALPLVVGCQAQAPINSDALTGGSRLLISGDYVKGKVFGFSNLVSGLCLGVRGQDAHGPGEGVEVYPCRGIFASASGAPDPHEPLRDLRWTVEWHYPGYWIKNVVSGLCLGVRGFDTAAWGTDAEVFTCEPAPQDPRNDNIWSIRNPWKNEVVKLMNEAPLIRGKQETSCLAVRGVDSHKPGDGVEVNECGIDQAYPLRDSFWTLFEYSQ